MSQSMSQSNVLHNNELSNRIILSLCQLSGLSYKPQEFFDENWERPYSKDCCSFEVLSKKPRLIKSYRDCTCYISIINDDSLLVVFRGTNNVYDWFADANVIRVSMDLQGVEKKDRPCVHWGMLRQIRSVENELTEFINNEVLENDQIRNIIFTGHSLGGGLATIAAQNFGHKYNYLNCMCVTFGAPRVGDENFKKRFNRVCKFSRRYVNEYDPIPSFPFSWRYTHVCPGLLINKNNMIYSETTFSRLLVVAWYQFINCFGAQYNPVDDHSIYDYYAKLESIFDEILPFEIEVELV